MVHRTEPEGVPMAKRQTAFDQFEHDTPAGDVVFSLSGGAVWASWPGKTAPVRLGGYDVVTYMMRDFLAQCDLAEGLAHNKRDNP